MNHFFPLPLFLSILVSTKPSDTAYPLILNHLILLADYQGHIERLYDLRLYDLKLFPTDKKLAYIFLVLNGYSVSESDTFIGLIIRDT